MKIWFLLIFLASCKVITDIDHVINDVSIESRECSYTPPHSSGGVQSSLDKGQTWSACYKMTCDDGYVLNEFETACVSKLLK